MGHMENRMDDLIASGINERDACYSEIDRLEKLNKQMYEALKDLIERYPNSPWIINRLKSIKI